MDVKFVSREEMEQLLTEEEKEMDRRAKEAVRADLEKAKFLGQPIAKYDENLKRAYIEYADGRREYAG